jgi:hypothetical protein
MIDILIIIILELIAKVINSVKLESEKIESLRLEIKLLQGPRKKEVLV